MANTINGYLKLLYKNYTLGLSLTSITVSSGSDDNLLDNDKDTLWESVGSDDLTTETIEYEFSVAKSIDRLLFINMNWKAFQVEYWTGSAWADFASVYSKAGDTAESSINITGNSDTTRYFEFTAVSTTKIKVSIDTTIAVDAQKSLGDQYIGKEIATITEDWTSDPNKFETNFNKGEFILVYSNMGSIKIEKGKKFYAKIRLKFVSNSADLTALQAVLSSGECSISPCGADGTLYSVEGWRLQDFYNCTIKGSWSGKHTKGRSKTVGYSAEFQLFEL